MSVFKRCVLFLTTAAISLAGAEPVAKQPAEKPRPAQAAPSGAPPGIFVIFNRDECPAGWELGFPRNSLNGSFLVATSDPQQVLNARGGISDPNLHAHQINASIDLPARPIAGANGCCNGQGARSGTINIPPSQTGRVTNPREQLPIRRVLACMPSQEDSE